MAGEPKGSSPTARTNPILEFPPHNDGAAPSHLIPESPTRNAGRRLLLVAAHPVVAGRWKRVVLNARICQFRIDLPHTLQTRPGRHQ